MRATLASPSMRAGLREWIGLAVLALPTLLVALDIGALFLALPHLSSDLQATSAQQLWITDIYGFMLAGFLISMGTLGDRIGRRKLLLIGAVAFTVASVLAAYSTSAEMLIVNRRLLGVAAATLSPSTLALISNMFRDERQRGMAISLWATCQFGGAALGPVIGGLLLENFWWGSVFLLGVPVMLLLLICAPALLPEYRNPNPGRLDLASVALSLAAILPVVYGIKELAASEADTPAVAFGAICVGVIFGVVMVRRQLKLTDPLLDLRLFQQSAISGALPTMMIASGALAGTSLMTSQYVQSVVGLSPGPAGLWQAPTGLGIAAGTLLSPAVLRWLKPVTAIVFGLTLSAIGLLVITLAGISGWLGIVVISIAVVAFGVGPLFVLGTGLVVGSAPPEKAGSAASLSETSNVFGSFLGLAMLGSIGAAVYRRLVSGSIPHDVPPDAADAARETIGSATGAAAPLPTGVAADLLEGARESFTTAMNVVAGIGSLIFVALIVLVTVMLRRTGSAAT
jgi:DHA2 family multidrug resistance protein-like MFS transporter